MHDDLIDAVKWAVDSRASPTPDKVAIMGGSYGGYATLVGLTFTPDAFACGVDIVGPSNLITLLEHHPAVLGADSASSSTKRMGDPRTEDGKKLLIERSPLTRADKIKQAAADRPGRQRPARQAGRERPDRRGDDRRRTSR